MKKLLFKLMIVLALMVCASFIGCGLDEYPLSITFKNTTDERITLISFSKEVKDGLPVIISPRTEIKVFSNHDHCESIHYTFLYKGRKYDTNTGYSEGHNKFTIVFTENGQNNINCLFVGRFWGRDEIELLHCEEIFD